MKTLRLLLAALVVACLCSACATHGRTIVTTRQTTTVREQEPVAAADQELGPSTKSRQPP